MNISFNQLLNKGKNLNSRLYSIFRAFAWACTLSPLLTPSIAIAYDIFDYQGGSAKVFGGAGITEGRGSDAILYNPANLTLSRGLEYHIDFAPSNLQYKFTPAEPGYGTGDVNIPFVPLVSGGVALKQKKSPLAFGLIFVPTGVGTETEVKDFPVSTAGVLQVADVKSTRKAYKLGFGLAYRINGSYSVGMSFVYSLLDSTSSVVLNGEPFLSVSNKHSFIIPRLGFRYRKKGLFTLGIEIQPQVKSWYSLSADVTGANSVNTYRQTYRPRVYGIGAKTAFNGPYQLFAQYRYENWVDGTFASIDPTQALTGDAPTEFLNAHSYILGGTQRIEGLGTGIASFSFFGPNKGQGVYDENGEVAFYGRGAQDFESLKRYHITAGLNRHYKKGSDRYYVSYIRGTGLSEENSPSAGFYELTIYMLGYGKVIR